MTAATNRRVMRAPEVVSRTGFCINTIYNKMKDGTFPRCQKIGKRAVGWDSHEVEAWLNGRFGGAV